MDEKMKTALFFHNPWWFKQEIPKSLLVEYERPIVNNLFSYFKLPRIIIIKGPRRTGKTTIIYQLINRLIKGNNIDPKRILYLSFDDIELRQDLATILKTYEQIVKRPIAESKELFLFLDEVHFLDDWQFVVKKYFDKKMAIKFIVSGSSASLMRKQSEALTGRTIEEIILPFSFYEYLEFKKIEGLTVVKEFRENFNFRKLPDITPLIPYQAQIEILLEEYKERGGFPHIFGIEEPIIFKKLLREDIIEKAIYRDLVEFYGVKKPFVLEKLFLYLIEHSSEILNILNISNSLKLSRQYTEKYINYLRQAFLLILLKRYSPSVEKMVRANEKVHIIDSGTLNLINQIEKGKLIESILARHLFFLNPCYWRKRFEVDFVIQVGKEIVPIEVKYKTQIKERELTGLYQFLDKFNSEIGFVITANQLAKKSYKKKKILFVPLWAYLLGL